MPTPLEIHKNTQRLVIYIGESDRWQGKPLYMTVLQRLRAYGLAGATVLRGVAGFGANSRIHSASIERLSEDLPLRIEVVDDAEKISRALEWIAPLVTNGLITLEPVQVVHYTHTSLNPFPAEKTVEEAMTQEVVTLSPEMTIAQAWEIMLNHTLKALPVIDSQRQVVGMLTDEDLLCCTPGRPAQAKELGENMVQETLQSLKLSSQKVANVMVKPVVVAQSNEPLRQAAVRMAHLGLKRMPVVDSSGMLVGIISRRDILEQVVQSSLKTPPPTSAHPLAKTIGEVMRQPIPSIQPEETLPAIINTLLETGSRRLIVLDDQRHPLGLISDGDVLTRVAPQEQKGVLAALQRLTQPPQSQATARSLMSPGMLTVRPEETLLDAAQKMLAERRKWLVVVDEKGETIGLVDRQVLFKAISLG